MEKGDRVFRLEGRWEEKSWGTKVAQNLYNSTFEYAGYHYRLISPTLFHTIETEINNAIDMITGHDIATMAGEGIPQSFLETLRDNQNTLAGMCYPDSSGQSIFTGLDKKDDATSVSVSGLTKVYFQLLDTRILNFANDTITKKSILNFKGPEEDIDAYGFFINTESEPPRHSATYDTLKSDVLGRQKRIIHFIFTEVAKKLSEEEVFDLLDNHVETNNKLHAIQFLRTPRKGLENSPPQDTGSYKALVKNLKLILAGDHPSPFVEKALPQKAAATATSKLSSAARWFLSSPPAKKAASLVSSVTDTHTSVVVSSSGNESSDDDFEGGPDSSTLSF